MLHWRQDLAHLSCLFKKILLQGVSKFEREGEGDLRLLKKYGPHRYSEFGITYDRHRRVGINLIASSIEVLGAGTTPPKLKLHSKGFY